MCSHLCYVCDHKKIIYLPVPEHQGRVLCIASSPNEEMVVSCASDETLRIWHCFQVDQNKKRIHEKSQRPSVYARGIR